MCSTDNSLSTIILGHTWVSPVYILCKITYQQTLLPSYYFLQMIPNWLMMSSMMSHSELQNDLNHLISWSEKWQLKFNTSKCKVLLFGQSDTNLI